MSAMADLAYAIVAVFKLPRIIDAGESASEALAERISDAAHKHFLQSTTAVRDRAARVSERIDKTEL